MSGAEIPDFKEAAKRKQRPKPPPSQTRWAHQFRTRDQFTTHVNSPERRTGKAEYDLTPADIRKRKRKVDYTPLNEYRNRRGQRPKK